MAYKIEYSEKVVKAFRKDLDRQIVARMMTKLEEAAALNDPSIKAKPLTLRLKGLWSFRIAGGYRVIADIQRDKLVIFAVAVGARKDVYDI